MVNQIAPGTRPVSAAEETYIAPLPGYAVDIAKWQSVFPRIICPQHVGKVGAIGQEFQIFRVAVAIRVCSRSQTFHRAVAPAMAYRADEFSKALLIRTGPFWFGDRPDSGTRFLIIGESPRTSRQT